MEEFIYNWNQRAAHDAEFAWQQIATSIFRISFGHVYEQREITPNSMNI